MKDVNMKGWDIDMLKGKDNTMECNISLKITLPDVELDGEILEGLDDAQVNSLKALKSIEGHDGFAKDVQRRVETVLKETIKNSVGKKKEVYDVVLKALIDSGEFGAKVQQEVERLLKEYVSK